MRASSETSKFHIYHSLNSRLRYMAGILPIQRKSQINQSINQSNQVLRNISLISMLRKFLKTNLRMLSNVSIIFSKVVRVTVNSIFKYGMIYHSLFIMLLMDISFAQRTILELTIYTNIDKHINKQNQ